ncbi:MAG: SPOR domain-containing protein [Polyangiaceae bacterium]|nr:SPOR domain-containing protein [Polyangiaceae bacterium]
MRARREANDGAGVRQLDDLQEREPGERGSRVSALVLASFGGACIVFAALFMMRSPGKAKAAPSDPLGELVARAHPASSVTRPVRDLGQSDVTFPEVLSDRDKPTTAMAAMRPTAKGSAEAAPVDTDALPQRPPPATDRLPVVPLPAQDVVQPPTAQVADRDTLQIVARQQAQEQPAETVAPGTPGGYQLQVSSFKSVGEADAFAAALRRRGHRAHVESAFVQGRGEWFRVRIGPFKFRRSADIYRQDFEAKERMVGFVVDPPKTKVRIGLSDEGD